VRGNNGFLSQRTFVLVPTTLAALFFSSVLMEKILRTNPDVGKIYVMVKAKDTQAALKRLQKEVFVLFLLHASRPHVLLLTN